MKFFKLIGIIIAVLTLIIGGFLSHKIYKIVVKKMIDLIIFIILIRI